MTTSAKVSISLPRDVLERAERERRATGESRSEFFRRAVEEYLKQKQRQLEVDRYVAGYVAEPESNEYERALEEIAGETLAGEPWE